MKDNTHKMYNDRESKLMDLCKPDPMPMGKVPNSILNHMESMYTERITNPDTYKEVGASWPVRKPSRWSKIKRLLKWPLGLRIMHKNNICDDCSDWG